LNKKLIVIDGNCLCWRSFYTVGHLSNEDGKPTGIIFGFLNEIFKIAKQYQTNKFVFCFDNKINFRKQIYPKYKAKRKKDSKISYEEVQSVNSQINQLRSNILKKLGFKNIYCQDGFESDDIMHEYVRYAYHLNEPKEREEWEEKGIQGKFSSFEKSKRSQNIMVTTDGDMFQSLSYCNIYNPQKKKLLTKDWFQENYNIDSDKWGIVKAYAGCSTDNVEGIKGVGEVKAIKYLNGDLVKGKIYNRIKNKKSKKIYERNLKLVKLPFYKDGIHLNIKKYRKENLRALRFVKVFDSLDFRSFLFQDQFEQWKSLFRLQDEYNNKLEKGR